MLWHIDALSLSLSRNKGGDGNTEQLSHLIADMRIGLPEVPEASAGSRLWPSICYLGKGYADMNYSLTSWAFQALRPRCPCPVTPISTLPYIWGREYLLFSGLVRRPDIRSMPASKWEHIYKKNSGSRTGSLASIIAYIVLPDCNLNLLLHLFTFRALLFQVCLENGTFPWLHQTPPFMVVKVPLPPNSQGSNYRVSLEKMHSPFSP